MLHNKTPFPMLQFEGAWSRTWVEVLITTEALSGHVLPPKFWG